MPFSLVQTSEIKLGQCDPRLQVIVRKAVLSFPWPVVVIYGFRDKDAQELAFKQGHTALHWPHSKHNQKPSKAVDIAPMKSPGRIDWDDTESFLTLGAIMMTEAKVLGITIRWGADWDMNGLMNEKGKREWDFPHFEIVEKGETINGKVVV